MSICRMCLLLRLADLQYMNPRIVSPVDTYYIVEEDKCESLNNFHKVEQLHTGGN